MSLMSEPLFTELCAFSESSESFMWILSAYFNESGQGF